MPIELDRGHDEPIFGLGGRPDFEGRLETATAVALTHGRRARRAADRLDGEIRDRLAAYVVGRSTMDDFAEWFASVEPIASMGANPGAQALAKMIRSRLGAPIDEAVLKLSLAPHAFVQVERDPSVAQVWTTSAVRTVRSPLVAVPM